MVEIFICQIQGQMPSARWAHYLRLLPRSEQVKNQRYLLWEDQYAHLFGKLLLQHALIKYGFADSVLDRIQYNEYQKPFINDNIYFNISHSGKYIGCGISSHIKLGLDIEKKVSPVNIFEFREIFSQAEWDRLNSIGEKSDLFYKLWTRKESIIKANGQGLAIPLHRVDVLSERVCLEDKVWFIKDVEVDFNYSASLATNRQDFNVQYKWLNFYEDR